MIVAADEEVVDEASDSVGEAMSARSDGSADSETGRGSEAEGESDWLFGVLEGGPSGRLAIALLPRRTRCRKGDNSSRTGVSSGRRGGSSGEDGRDRARDAVQHEEQQQ